jgi:two-component system sensor histidine kinase KdpD
VPLQKREYPLAEVVDAILGRLAARLQSHPVALSVPSDLPPVPLDHAAFEQVLTNLLDNAVKYSPRGSPISIAARAVGNFVEIAVADQGPGIPPEVQQAVFGKFYRADQSGRVPGSGLGLAIVKGFVEAHGGKVWISRHAGGGTRVRFLLPLSAGEDALEHRAEAPPAAATAAADLDPRGVSPAAVERDGE